MCSCIRELVRLGRGLAFDREELAVYDCGHGVREGCPVI